MLVPCIPVAAVTANNQYIDVVQQVDKVVDRTLTMQEGGDEDPSQQQYGEGVPLHDMLKPHRHVR